VAKDVPTNGITETRAECEMCGLPAVITPKYGLVEQSVYGDTAQKWIQVIYSRIIAFRWLCVCGHENETPGG
jgi:hypothetical protein